MPALCPEELYAALDYEWLDRYPYTARLLRNMVAEEARASAAADETRSLCGWEPDEDTVSRVSVYATLPRKDKWGSLRSLFSRKSDASIDLTEEDLAQTEGEVKPKKRFGFRRWKSSTSIQSCPDTISIGSASSIGSTTSTASTASTASKKQKTYRRTRSSTMARPLGVWQEEGESGETEDPEIIQERRQKELGRWIPKEDDSLRIRSEKRSLFGSRTSLSSIFKKEEDDPVRPLVLPTGDRDDATQSSYHSRRYRSLASEDNVLKPRNKVTVDTSSERKDTAYQNGTARSATHSRSTEVRPSQWRNMLKTPSKYSIGGKRIASDAVYLMKLRDILNAPPTRGPPYLPTMLSYNMYMGSQKNADDLALLRRLGITHVLNMAGTRHHQAHYERSPYDSRSGVAHYLMIPALDHEDYDIKRHLSEALGFLDHCKRTGGKVLVHCNMGVNRSGAVCAAYLMTDQKMNLLEMAKYIKLKRNFVLVNRGFQKQLVQFGREQGMLEPV